ncbi:MAG: hypothetical protein WBO24_16615 [Nitrospirales bacterium]
MAKLMIFAFQPPRLHSRNRFRFVSRGHVTGLGEADRSLGRPAYTLVIAAMGQSTSVLVARMLMINM